MIRPRFSILGLMATVAVAALDCAAAQAVRTLEQPRYINHPWCLTAELILLGGVPMANVLGLVAWRRLRSGVGPGAFPKVGGLVAAAFVAGSVIGPGWVELAAEEPLDLVRLAFFGGRMPPPIVTIAAVVAGLLAVQLAPSLLIGAAAGWFGRRYRVRFAIERRRPGDSAAPIPG